MFTDLTCVHCGNALGTIDQLWDEHPGKLRLVMKQLPVRPNAGLPAEAALAADAQGKFWELHDLMIAHQDDLSHDRLLALAERAGLDAAAFRTALDQHTYAAAVDADKATAAALDINATPAFVINGKRVFGNLPLPNMRQVVDQAISDLWSAAAPGACVPHILRYSEPKGWDMRTIANLIWFVFGGCWMGLGWWLAGLLMLISIVGIPWARSCFVFGTFCFAPFGREAIDRRELTGTGDLGTGALGFLGNVIWFVFAGIWLAIGHVTSAILNFLTIIGIPFGIQHLKLAGCALAPVGKTVVLREVAAEARRRNAMRHVDWQRS